MSLRVIYLLLTRYLKKIVVPVIGNLGFLHRQSFLNIPDFPQLTRWKYTPNILKTLLDEYLNFIVAKINANRGFVDEVRVAYTNGLRNFHMISPEMAGSAVLLAKELQSEFADLKIIAVSDEISQEHLGKIGLLIDFSGPVAIEPRNGFKPKEGSFALCLNAWHRMTDKEKSQAGKFLLTNFDQFLIGEANSKSLWQLIGMILFVPGMALLTAPFIRPFRWERLAYTYIFPVFPFVLSLDGIAALFRIEPPEKIKERLLQIGIETHEIQCRKVENGRGGRLLYVLAKRRKQIS